MTRAQGGRSAVPSSLSTISTMILLLSKHTGATSSMPITRPRPLLAFVAYSHHRGHCKATTKRYVCTRMSSEGVNLLERLGSPTTVAAPMVQQSDLAFRTLARRYGSGLVYTQMMHATNFAHVQTYRDENWDGVNDSAFDRPLIAQFAGDDAGDLVKAAQHIEHEVDAVDLNLGCPQKIAKRGHYGSFLLEEQALVVRLLSSMCRHLSVPVTAKIRLLPTERETLELVKAIEDTGVALLCVHGRTREQNKIKVGAADWKTIKKIKETVQIPVIANGGVETYEDYVRCLGDTGADAVMASEGLLENPSLFLPESTLLLNGEKSASSSLYASWEEEAYALVQRQLRFSREYLDLAAKYWPKEGVASVKGHLFKFCYQILELPVNHDIRERLGAKGNKLDDYRAIIEELTVDRYGDLNQALRRTDGQLVSRTSWYRRHREGQRHHHQQEEFDQLRLQASEEEKMSSLKERLLQKRAAKLAAAAAALQPQIQPQQSSPLKTMV